MIHQTCAICETDNSSVLYPENFDIKRIDEKTFSARRLPDRVHYRMVTCNTCGLVYSNPILEFDKIAALYKKSFVSYDSHVENLKKTYGRYLHELESYSIKKGKLLEIGCGNGFFLEEAKTQGYTDVNGVEPGEKSAKSARPDIAKKIIIDMFRPGLFEKNSFDVICCFQTLDHIPNPNEFLSTCYSVLKKGGLVLFFNHDVSALTAKLFGERSPIIDIEHTYLYDKNTMQQIFEKHSFNVLKVASPLSVHTLSYWMRLIPMPKKIKPFALSILDKIGFGKMNLWFKAGNIYLIARK